MPPYLVPWLEQKRVRWRYPTPTYHRPHAIANHLTQYSSTIYKMFVSLLYQIKDSKLKSSLLLQTKHRRHSCYDREVDAKYMVWIQLLQYIISFASPILSLRLSKIQNKFVLCLVCTITVASYILLFILKRNVSQQYFPTQIHLFFCQTKKICQCVNSLASNIYLTIWTKRKKLACWAIIQ